MQNDPAFAREALRAGAIGYVLKEAADSELVQAVRLAADGRTYLNPELGARLAAEPQAANGPPDDLSAREIEVLRLIALGHTNSEIASAAVPERAHGRVAPRAHPAEDRAHHARRAGGVRARARTALSRESAASPRRRRRRSRRAWRARTPTSAPASATVACPLRELRTAAADATTAPVCVHVTGAGA